MSFIKFNVKISVYKSYPGTIKTIINYSNAKMFGGKILRGLFQVRKAKSRISLEAVKLSVRTNGKYLEVKIFFENT